MMRLVFLFVAEERRLLPIDDPRYAETLAATTLRAQLQERADRDGEDPLERSTAAWHRLLALFRAVHGGIEHDALRLPAYGGGLFDPDRYPFLEGRAPEIGLARPRAARPLPVDDRTMLHMLDALQTLEQGGARACCSPTGRSTSSRSATSTRACSTTPRIRLSDTALALGGKLEPELALGELERWAADGRRRARRARWPRRPGRSASAIAQGARQRRSPTSSAPRLRAACGNDDALLERVAPYHALLRDDLRGDPLVFLAGRAVRHAGARRRASRHVLHAAPARRGGRPARARARSSTTRPGAGARPGEVEAQDRRRAARPEGRRHRDGLGRVPRRRLPLPRRAAARGVDRRRRADRDGRRAGSPRRLAASRTCPPTRRARRARPAPRRRALPVRRRQEPDGRRDGQALALAHHARQGPAVHVRRPRAARRRLAARRHRPAAAARRAPRPATGRARSTLDLGFDEIEAAVERALVAAPRPRGVRRARHPRRRAQGAAPRRGRRGARRRAAPRRPRRRRGARQRDDADPLARPRSRATCG